MSASSKIYIPPYFPCIQDGNYTTLNKCFYCENSKTCDHYATMLNETEIVDNVEDE